MKPSIISTLLATLKSFVLFMYAFAIFFFLVLDFYFIYIYIYIYIYKKSCTEEATEMAAKYLLNKKMCF